MKVAIIASGLDEKEHAPTSAQMEDEEFHKKMESFYGIKNKKTEVPTETITDDETEEAINENDSNSDTMGQSNGFNIFKNIKEQLAIFVEKMTED